jgi:ribonuclease P protein component
MEIYAQEDFSTQPTPPLEDPWVSYPYENKGGPRGFISASRGWTQTFGRQTGIPGLGASTTAGWPKEARLLRRSDFERVYRTGKRFSSSLFTAFAVRSEGRAPSRVGFTTPRALGKSVIRNRVRRRLREVVRVQYPQLTPGWELIFNPRRALLSTGVPVIQGEVSRLFASLSGAEPSGAEPSGVKP